MLMSAIIKSHMQRTTLNLPATLHHRLMFEAKNESKTFSDFIRDLLEQAINYREDARLKQTYEALNRIKGIAEGHSTASTTIDQILYGENGVWKGRNE